MEAPFALLAAVDWAISSVLKKCSALEAWTKQVGLRKELASLNKELNKIHIVIINIKKKSWGSTWSESLLYSVWDLRHVTYKADDLLEQLNCYRIQSEVEPQYDRGSTFSSLKAFSKFKRFFSLKKKRHINLLGMACSMKSLIQILRDVSYVLGYAIRSDLHDKLSFWKESNEEIQLRQPVRTVRISFLRETRILGRDEERDSLIQLLLDYEAADRALSTFAIIGSCGVGKTTLAQLVYKDLRVKTYFELQMWVTLTSNFDGVRVAHEILRQVSHDDRCCKIQNLQILHQMLAQSLRSKRFLLVLDDLWEDEHKDRLESLLAPLKHDAMKGSVILVTTRMHSVAHTISSSKSIYLERLEQSEFWNLFISFTFEDESVGRHRNLVCVGRQIAKKLKGNPLLAKNVGALLKRDLHEEHWRRILKQQESQETQGNVGIMPVVRLSYENLPFILQQCLSYCALFPKDYPLDREDMVRIWIAQGFVDSKLSRTEDIGSQYFNFLVHHAFLQKVDKENRTLGCMWSHYQTNDLVSDLVSSHEWACMDGSWRRPVPSTVRHLSIVRKDFDKELVDRAKCISAENLRSFMYFGKEDRIYPAVEKIFLSSIKWATNLRVLRLNATHSSESLLPIIAKFTHLRYLRLDSDQPLETLPEDICKLYQLQFLDIINCGELHKLPDKFSNLVNLEHFIAEKRVHYLIADVGKLTSLKELHGFRVEGKNSFGIQQLGNLKELGGSLSICNLMNVRSKEEASEARIVEKESLSQLCLSWDREDSEFGDSPEADVLEGLQPHGNLKSLHILGYGGSIVPTWLSSSTPLINLESIYLQDCAELDILPPLGLLPFLKEFHMSSMHRVREIGPQYYGISRDIGFKSLNKMVIEDMPALEAWHWRDQLTLFPYLQVLEIRNCPQLRELPSVGRFPYLCSLVINKCPRLERLHLEHLPHTDQLFDISISGVASFGELYFSGLCGQLQVQICGNHNLRALDELLRFDNLWILKSLCIKNCSKLRSLSWKGIFSLVCLRNLRVEECHELVSLSEENWPLYPPVNQFSSLEIVNCKNLQSLPSDLCSLPSLKKLTIIGCICIMNFPQKGLPASLEELNVINCSVELSDQSRHVRHIKKLNIQLGEGKT